MQRAISTWEKLLKREKIISAPLVLHGTLPVYQTLKRESAIERYVEEYKKINKADATDCKALKENLRLLIKQKDRLYPDVNVQIVGSRIENINGRNHAIVVSARIN